MLPIYHASINLCLSQNEDDPGEGCSSQAERQIDPRTERSLEECHKLILQWASELQSVDKVKLTVLQKIQTSQSYCSVLHIRWHALTQTKLSCFFV